MKKIVSVRRLCARVKIINLLPVMKSGKVSIYRGLSINLLPGTNLDLQWAATKGAATTASTGKKAFIFSEFAGGNE